MLPRIRLLTPLQRELFGGRWAVLTADGIVTGATVREAWAAYCRVVAVEREMECH